MKLQNVILPALVGVASAQTPSLLQALNSTAELSMLNALVSGNTALAQTLASLTNVTVLAPNNAAFEAFNAANPSASAEYVGATIVYHVLNGTYTSISNMSQIIPTYLTSELPGGLVNLTTSQVVEARNISGNATFFSGYKQNSTTIGAAVPVTNGVVHIINSVLTLPGSIASTGVELGLTSAVGALVNASLAQVVDTTNDLTVFVPNNAAFQAIGSALPNVTTEQLAAILQYHVVNGSVLYSTSLSNTTVKSLQGNNLTVTVVNSTTVYVNNARVLIPDVLVANGVVHVIDEVLNPLNTSAPRDQPNFPGASSASGTPFATQSGVPSPTRSINTSTIGGGATSTSSPGAAWQVQPTGMAAALIVGAALLL